MSKKKFSYHTLKPTNQGCYVIVPDFVAEGKVYTYKIYHRYSI